MKIFKLITEGVLETHKKGYLHGNIHPDNIMMDADGKPKLANFENAMKIGS